MIELNVIILTKKLTVTLTVLACERRRSCSVRVPREKMRAALVIRDAARFAETHVVRVDQLQSPVDQHKLLPTHVVHGQRAQPTRRQEVQQTGQAQHNLIERCQNLCVFALPSRLLPAGGPPTTTAAAGSG